MDRTPSPIRCLFLCALALPLLHCAQVADQHAGPAGSGTPDDPYRIAMLEDLRWLSENPTVWDAHFVQVADIDARATSGWNDGAGFLPIGDPLQPFAGTYHGDGHSISGLAIHRTDANSSMIGLFGTIAVGGAIDRLGLVDVSIEGGPYCGSLAGENHGTIRQCQASGRVSSAMDEVGGLVGRNRSDGLIEDCRADVAVEGRSRIGGLVGVNAGSISRCEAAGTVSGSTVVGGLVGVQSHVEGAIIRHCHARGRVVGSASLGGLVGESYAAIEQSWAGGAVEGRPGRLDGVDGSWQIGGLVGLNAGLVSDAFAVGAVSGDSLVGGLAGNVETGTLQSVYAAGMVTGRILVGGLAGRMRYGRVPQACHWDVQATGQDEGWAFPDSASTRHAKGLTTSAMRIQASFAGWDFTGTWTIEEGASYPWLRAVERPSP